MLGIELSSILVSLWHQVLNLFGIDFCIELKQFWQPKWLPKSSLSPTIFDSKFDFSQHTAVHAFPRGVLLETPWLIVADVGAFLVSFCILLAPAWHPFGNLLQLCGKFAGLSWVPQNSTFEGTPMLGPAELSAVAGTRSARLDIL